MPQKPTIQLLLKDSYLVMIKNSVNDRIFKNFYAKVCNSKKDLLNNGEYSCAFFVSSILLIFKLIKEPHLTVKSTLIDLKEFGWKKISKIKIGAILMWEEFDFGDGDLHEHIGFYVGNNKVVSNDYKTGKPKLHDYKFGNKNRKIINIWYHKNLDK